MLKFEIVLRSGELTCQVRISYRFPMGTSSRDYSHPGRSSLPQPGTSGEFSKVGRVDFHILSP
jgi:hypothetical protein